jgi:predicted dehydrogenase/threonine dehydrogenase-like Zn-dependent dehydrogenase
LKKVSQNLRDGRIRVLDVPAPTLQPHGVLARTAFSLISAGTERAKIDLGQKSLLGKARSRPDDVKKVVDKVRRDGLLNTYRTVRTRLEQENPIGYCSAGVVLQVGELAAGLRPGDWVACGGEYAGHAEIVYAPGTLCASVPDGVGLDEAAFTTLGAIALQGVRQSGACVGERVAVIGLGLVGQITVQILRAAGCEVAGADPDDACCAAVAALGAAVTSATGSIAAEALLAVTGGIGYDAVIITAGTKSDEPVELAAHIARDRGTVVVVGDVGMKVPRALFYEKELTLKLSRSYGPGRYDPMYEEMAVDYPIGYVRWTEQRNMAEFLRLVADGRVDVKSLITHRFAVDDAVQAYATVSDPHSGSVGVLLEYLQSEPELPRIVVGRPAAGEPVQGAIGVGLLGAGNFATATLLPALTTDGRFAPRSVYTPSGLSARDVAERNGFAFCAGSPDEVIGDPDTRAVIIATRHASHAALAVQSLLAGKTVFVEKPPAMTEAELDQVVAAQRESGGRLMAGFNRRFAPHVRKMVSALARRSSPVSVVIRVNAGAIPATHWTQRPEEGGGRIVGELCHFVDLAACLAGAPPTRVFAMSADPRKSPLLTDDLSVLVSFVDGSIATVIYTAGGDTAYPKERIEVFCEGRVMVSDDFKRLTLTQGGHTHASRSQQADKGHEAEMKAFLDLAAGRPVTELTFGDCVSSMAATFKVVESLTTGEPVAVPEVTAS